MRMLINALLFAAVADRVLHPETGLELVEEIVGTMA